MRDPVLRVTRSSLKAVLKEVKFTNPAETADSIFYHAQKFQIRNRYNVVVNNSKTKQKVQKTVDAESPIIEKFNLILYTVRQAAKHQRIKTILKTDKDYLLLKEVAKMAYDFSEHFDIVPREDGYKEFCSMGLQYMGKKYALNKFKTYQESIYEYFESVIAISEDKEAEKTLQFYSEWQSIMLHTTGLESQIHIDKDARKFVNIVYSRQQADEVKANYADWIQAQFEGLAFANAIPELSQLHGENALKRYEKRCRDQVGNEGKEKEVLNTNDRELGNYYDHLK